MNIEFKECSVCRAKPGSPTLCPTCVANRSTIVALIGFINESEKKLHECCHDMADLFDELYEYFGKRDINSLEKRGLHSLHDQYYGEIRDFDELIKSGITFDGNRK